MSKITSESLSEVHGSVQTQHHKGWKKILSFIGPAYLVSVGYMDPGNWATDLMGGSQYGYRLIWILLMSNIIALLLQYLSARLGIVRGMDLAQASRYSYPKFINFCLYILAQIAIIACDLAEIIGMAIGLQLLFGIPLIWGISITITDTLLLLFLLNKGVRKMEIFIVSLIFIIGVSFLIEFFIIKPDLKEIATGFIPTELNGSALYIAIGIIGATVMPHNLYLHSSLVQTRKFERTFKGIKEALKFNLIDTSIALNLAFFVNASILILAATAFYKNGYHEIAEIEDAHRLLGDIFGDWSPKLFAIALIAAGQSSTITGTLAGQIVMEGHINLRIKPWLRRFLTRILAIIPAYIAIISYGDKSLNSLLILSQVVLSLQLGFAIIPLIHFTSNKFEMKAFTIPLWMKIAAWICASLIIFLNIKLVFQEINTWISNSTSPLLSIILIPLAVAIGLLLLFIIIYPIFKAKTTQLQSNSQNNAALTIGSIKKFEYQKVAIPVDFSTNDAYIIQHAFAQGGLKAQYFLIHIIETASAHYHGKNTLDFETQKNIDLMMQYAEQLESKGYAVIPKIGYGRTAYSIAKISNAEQIELIVLGAHGHRGWKDILYGTTIDRLRHLVKIPVLIVNKGN